MNVVVARAGLADLEALLPLVAAYRQFYRRPPDDSGERSFMHARLATGTSVVFVAYDDTGVAAGFVQLFPTFSTVRLGPSLILEDLFVDTRFRRYGVATQLLERAESYAHEIGAKGMFLETAMDNVQAQALYKRCGWAREAEFYKYNAPEPSA